MAKKIINAYPRFKEFNDLAMVGDYVTAILNPNRSLGFGFIIGRFY